MFNVKLDKHNPPGIGGGIDTLFYPSHVSVMEYLKVAGLKRYWRSLQTRLAYNQKLNIMLIILISDCNKFNLTQLIGYASI